MVDYVNKSISVVAVCAKYAEGVIFLNISQSPSEKVLRPSQGSSSSCNSVDSHDADALTTNFDHECTREVGQIIFSSNEQIKWTKQPGVLFHYWFIFECIILFKSGIFFSFYIKMLLGMIVFHTKNTFSINL